MRIDRHLSIHPLLRRICGANQAGLPILMYHRVSDRTEGRHPYFETNISAAALDRHLQYLYTHQFRSASLSHLQELPPRQPVEKRRVVITFDDAFQSFYTDALPLLGKYGFGAILFVPSGLVGKAQTVLGPEPIMTWAQIGEAHQQGVEIGSHTVNHWNLYRADPAVLKTEIKNSKAEIEDHLGESIRSFAYPYAFPEHDRHFCNYLSRLLEEAGYEHGVSTSIGRAKAEDNRFFLPRLPVNSHDDLDLFAAKLDGYYDWLYTPQYIHKLLKSALSSRKRLAAAALSARS